MKRNQFSFRSDEFTVNEDKAGCIVIISNDQNKLIYLEKSTAKMFKELLASVVDLYPEDAHQKIAINDLCESYGALMDKPYNTHVTLDQISADIAKAFIRGEEVDELIAICASSPLIAAKTSFLIRNAWAKEKAEEFIRYLTNHMVPSLGNGN